MKNGNFTENILCFYSLVIVGFPLLEFCECAFAHTCLKWNKWFLFLYVVYLLENHVTVWKWNICLSVYDV